MSGYFIGFILIFISTVCHSGDGRPPIQLDLKEIQIPYLERLPLQLDNDVSEIARERLNEYRQDEVQKQLDQKKAFQTEAEALKSLEDLDRWYSDHNPEQKAELYPEYRRGHNARLLLLHRARLLKDLETITKETSYAPPQSRRPRSSLINHISKMPSKMSEDALFELLQDATSARERGIRLVEILKQQEIDARVLVGRNQKYYFDIVGDNKDPIPLSRTDTSPGLDFSTVMGLIHRTKKMQKAHGPALALPYEDFDPEDWSPYSRYQITKEKLKALEVTEQGLAKILEDPDYNENLFTNLEDVSQSLGNPPLHQLRTKANDLGKLGTALAKVNSPLLSGVVNHLQSEYAQTQEQITTAEAQVASKGPFRPANTSLLLGSKNPGYVFDPELLDFQFHRTVGTGQSHDPTSGTQNPRVKKFLTDLGITKCETKETKKNLSYEFGYPHQQGRTHACMAFGVADDMEFTLGKQIASQPKTDISPWFTYLLLKAHDSEDIAGACQDAQPFRTIWAEYGDFSGGITDMNKALTGLSRSPTCSHDQFDPNHVPSDYPTRFGTVYTVDSYASLLQTEEEPDLNLDFDFFRCLIDHEKPPIISIGTTNILETEDWIELSPGNHVKDKKTGKEGIEGHVIMVTGYDAEGEVDPFDGIKKPFFWVRDSLRANKTPYKVSASALAAYTFEVYKIKSVTQH